MPFTVVSWVLSRAAKPLSFFNDRILRTPAYLDLSKKDKKGNMRTQLSKGTTIRKDFLPSFRAERRELAIVHRQLSEAKRQLEEIERAEKEKELKEAKKK